MYIQSASKFSIIGTNYETQLKIHFQAFPSIAYNISEIFYILYKKHAFVHLNAEWHVLISLYLMQYKYVKVRFKKSSPQAVMYRKTFE